MTDDERRKFILWLKQEVETGRGIIEQMKKLGVMEPVIKHEQIKIAAKLLIAQELDATEIMTIGGGAITKDRTQMDPSVVALIACTNCTHQPNKDAACAACIGDAIRGRQM